MFSPLFFQRVTSCYCSLINTSGRFVAGDISRGTRLEHAGMVLVCGGSILCSLLFVPCDFALPPHRKGQS